MADDKKNKKDIASTPTSTPSSPGTSAVAGTLTSTTFDWNAFFSAHGQQYTEEDMRDMSSLIPMVSFEEAWEQKWPPLFGKLVGRALIHIDKKEEDPEKSHRWFYLVEAKTPTKAMKGTGTNKTVADIKKGELVYWPESGSLKNREELHRVADDPNAMFDVAFRVEGEPIDLGKKGRNPMWPIEAKLVGNAYQRESRYFISSEPKSLAAAAPANGKALPTGEVVNQAGQPAGNLFARP